MEVVFLLVPVGKFDGGLFLLIFVDVLLLALLAGGAGSGFDFVGQGIDVSAAIGEDVLDGQNLGAESRDLFLQFVAAGPGGFVGVIVGLFQLLILANSARTSFTDCADFDRVLFRNAV